MVLILYKLPIEVQILVYQFINPISKSPINIHDGKISDWCYVCGEFLSEICVRKIIDNKIIYQCLNCFNERRC